MLPQALTEFGALSALTFTGAATLVLIAMAAARWKLAGFKEFLGVLVPLMHEAVLSGVVAVPLARRGRALYIASITGCLAAAIPARVTNNLIVCVVYWWSQ